MAGFNCISLKLKEMYQMITLGGDAELELVDSLDPFSEVGCSGHVSVGTAPCWATLELITSQEHFQEWGRGSLA